MAKTEPRLSSCTTGGAGFGAPAVAQPTRAPGRVRSIVPPVLAAAISQRGRRASSHLLWHERTVTASGCSVRLNIPMVGRADSDLAARLGRSLSDVWVGQATASGAVITSVSVAVSRRDHRSVLTLFLSVDREPRRHRIDDARMARQLRRALAAEGGAAG